MFRTGTTHNGFDTCLDLKDVERFGDIIICTVVQSQDLVHVFAFGSKHNDRHIGKFPDLLAYFQPVHLRQHQVQKDNVVFILLRLLHRFFSIVSTVHFHSVLFQIKADSFYDQFFVIYY